MRTIETHPQKLPELKPDDGQVDALASELRCEIEDAIGVRNRLEVVWRESLRQYEGQPKTVKRHTPIENAPNVEVTVGAAACDTAYAQMLDLIYTVSPLITTRPLDERYITHSKAMQRFANLIPDDTNLRPASEHAIFDTCQLGTGVYYIPFVTDIQKTDVQKVIRRRPQILAMPPEDLIVPGGAYASVQDTRFAGLRFFYTANELNVLRDFRGWDVSKFAKCGNKDWVRQRRESLAKTGTDAKAVADLFEVIAVYIHYDIDGDGQDEDLLVYFDRTSGAIGKLKYNPHDCRPIETMCYQIRPHMLYGVGIMEMLRSYQEEMTELHNHQLVNVLLANCRLWKARNGTIPDGTLRIWPNRLIELGEPDDLKGEQLADIYQSLPMTQQMVMSLAENRVGLNNLTQPRQSQVFGNRTPGITATSLLGQMNKRFTPAFDGVRLGTSGAVRQAIYRYAELVRASDTDVQNYILTRLGEADGKLVIELMKDPAFDQYVAVELTASSASINRDADRQNAIILANLLGPYYEKMIQMVQVAASPMTPDPVRQTCLKVAASASELMDRTMRTFEQIRDPKTFIVDPSAEIQQAEDEVNAQRAAQMVGMMMGAETGMDQGSSNGDQPMNNETSADSGVESGFPVGTQ